MRRPNRFIPMALAALAAAPLPAMAGPPVVLAQARYVALGYELGNGFRHEAQVRGEDVLPEERQALARIRGAIESWGRLVIVEGTMQPELLIAIRRGRLVSYGVGTRIGDQTGGPPGGAPIGVGTRESVQVSTPDDMIIVYDARVGGVAWRGIKANGLQGAGPPLFRDFRAEVEKADRLAKKR
jgi:hypothetical protein